MALPLLFISFDNHRLQNYLLLRVCTRQILLLTSSKNLEKKISFSKLKSCFWRNSQGCTISIANLHCVSEAFRRFVGESEIFRILEISVLKLC